MSQGIEITPYWLEQIYEDEKITATPELVAELNSKVIVIEAVRAIDAFDVYNRLCDMNIRVIGRGQFMKVHPREFIYVGVDGVLFVIAFRAVIDF